MNPKIIESLTKTGSVIIGAAISKYGPKLIKIILERLGRK